MRTVTDEAWPRILLVEDEPTSQIFFRSTLEDLPASVDSADSVSTAISLATDFQYDLWLIDVNLPDGHGDRLLTRLRALHSPFPPALAHTADDSPELRQAMLAAGFHDIFLKPIAPAQFLSLVRNVLAMDTKTDWDDQAAQIALGNSAHVPVLRQLFLDELPATCKNVVNAAHSGDLPTLRAGLHRLQASCGFVGAVRLAAAVTELQAAPASAAALEHFRNAVKALLPPGSSLKT